MPTNSAESDLPLDHAGLQVLPPEVCMSRLAAAPIGRIAFVQSGEPVILPVNHGLDRTSIVFRSSFGSKLFAAANNQSVCFEIDGVDPVLRAGWSIVVRGVATVVDDPAEIARLDRLDVLPWAIALDRAMWVRIAAYEITGRQIIGTPS